MVTLVTVMMVTVVAVDGGGSGDVMVEAVVLLNIGNRNGGDNSRSKQ